MHRSLQGAPGGAVVLASPYAGREPVRQHKRRGRYPKSIPTIWGESMRRAASRQGVEEVERLEEAVAALASTLNFARSELAIARQECKRRTEGGGA